MSSPYGPGLPPGVLPPPQATVWPPQHGAVWPPAYPTQPPAGQPAPPWPPLTHGPNPFDGFGPPPRQRSGCLRVLLLGVAAVVLVLGGVSVLLGSVLDRVDDTGVAGRSTVPSPSPRPEQGTAADVLVNNAIYRAGGLGRLDCPAEPLGDGGLAAQKRYYDKLFRCLNDGWRPALARVGIKRPDPGLVVFDQPVSTPCGNFTPKSGRVLAFYCYGNSVMYTDVLQMEQAFGPRQDLAFLLTIAHEYGHHIQGVSGLFYARAAYLQEHPAEKLDSSRRNELQASCFGGVFIAAVARSYPLTGRLPEFEFQASHSFGDSPDTPPGERTHGLAASQGYWIVSGANAGETRACDTFSAPANLVR